MAERKQKIQKKSVESFKKWLMILPFVCVVFVAVIYIFFVLLWQPSSVCFSLNAVIVDQLSRDFRNQTFVDDVTAILTEHGFNVSYYNHTKTDVAFFKELAKNNYGIIILRVHSALREGDSAVDFFTSEPFDEYAHSKEVNEGLLVRGILNYSGEEYFAITPKFVKELRGNFPKSIVIAMGCWSLKPNLEQMAETFIRKGAKAYIGWSDMVTPSHTDAETAKLVRRLLFEDKTLSKAVSEAMSDWVAGREARMRFYPESEGNLKLSDLIEEAKSHNARLSQAVSSHNSFIIFSKLQLKAFNVSFVCRRFQEN